MKPRIFNPEHLFKPCPACARIVARWTNGGRIPPHGKRTVRHKCPHDVWCPQGDPLWGSHSNGRQVACKACADACRERQRAEDATKGAR